MWHKVHLSILEPHWQSFKSINQYSTTLQTNHAKESNCKSSETLWNRLLRTSWKSKCFFYNRVMSFSETPATKGRNKTSYENDAQNGRASWMKKTMMLLSHKVVSDSLRPHRLQHTRLPCPPLSLGVRSNSYPYSISNSVWLQKVKHILRLSIIWSLLYKECSQFEYKTLEMLQKSQESGLMLVFLIKSLFLSFWGGIQKMAKGLFFSFLFLILIGV